MIEPLQTFLWTTQDVDLNGELTGTETRRVICSYFPPHTSWPKELLESGSEYLHTSKWDGPAIIDTAEGSFEVSQALDVKLDNGGAMYLLGVIDEHGNREGWLWKLTEGNEANG